MSERKPFKTTIEIWNESRDDLTLLAKAEAEELGIGKLSIADYLRRAISREKEAKNIK